MNNWPVGLSTGCFYRRSLFEVLPDIAASGISLLEICSYPAHLNFTDPQEVKAAAEAIHGHGLTPFSFHAPFAAGLDISALDEAERDDSVQRLLTAVEAAGVLGVRCFVIHPGPEREGKAPTAEHLQRLHHAAHSLERLAQAAAKRGMQLVLENMLAHLRLGSTADLLWLMDRLQPWQPGFCLDTGHAHLAGNLAGMAGLFPQQLRMVHAADNHGVRDEHLAPGQGGIDWPRLIAQLHAVHFTGTWILELAGDDHNRPAELLAEALGARQLLLT